MFAFHWSWWMYFRLQNVTYALYVLCFLSLSSAKESALVQVPFILSTTLWGTLSNGFYSLTCLRTIYLCTCSSCEVPFDPLREIGTYATIHRVPTAEFSCILLLLQSTQLLWRMSFQEISYSWETKWRNLEGLQWEKGTGINGYLLFCNWKSSSTGVTVP